MLISLEMELECDYQIESKIYKKIQAIKTKLKSGDIANLIGLLSHLREWKKKALNKDQKYKYLKKKIFYISLNFFFLN